MTNKFNAIITIITITIIIVIVIVFIGDVREYKNKSLATDYHHQIVMETIVRSSDETYDMKLLRYRLMNYQDIASNNNINIIDSSIDTISIYHEDINITQYFDIVYTTNYNDNEHYILFQLDLYERIFKHFKIDYKNIEVCIDKKN